MKKIIFPLILSLFMFSAFQSIAQTPWYVGGNALAAAGRIGSTTNRPVVFITNNRERGRVDSNGNWGLGSATSSDKVRINTPAGSIPFRAMVNGLTAFLVHSGGGVAIGSGSVPPVNGLYVATQVGIGIAAPAFTLDVRGTSAIGQFKSSSGVTAVIIDKPSAAQNGYLIHRTAGVDRWTEGTIGNNNFNIRNPGIGSNALTIDITNNNVGLGTTAPLARLHVEPAGNDGGIYVSGNNGTALRARSFQGVGISAYSETAYGVRAECPQGTGILTSGYICGVETSGVEAGLNSFSTDGIGLYARSTNSIGVYGSTFNSSSYAGYFSGDVFTTGAYLPSDEKLKKNIASVDNAMDMINRLQPKNYEYRNDGNMAKMNLPKGQHYGFIAQEIKKVLPNLIKETSFDAAKTLQPEKTPSVAPLVNGTAPAGSQPVQPIKGTKGEKVDFEAVNYIELIPIMVKAMQEQDIKIQKQDFEITNLKSEINELKALIIKNENGATTMPLTGYLKQNTPNPPNGNTVIKYFAPSDSRNA